MAEEIIKCYSTTTGGKGKYEVIKAYLNMHHMMKQTLKNH